MGEVEKRHPRGVIKGARTGKTGEKAFIIHWGDKCLCAVLWSVLASANCTGIKRKANTNAER